MTLSYVTADIPGLGGAIKSGPGHFVVEELPLYEPSGQGAHVYVRLSRAGWNTRDLVKRLASIFGLKDVDVGCAGLKDKDAVAIQTFSLSLPAADEDAVARRIETELPVRVLWARRHGNKLKTGHLLGNRFSVVLAGVEPGALVRAEEIASILRSRGLANYYGPQRFGLEGDNARRGREVLQGRGPRQSWLRRFLLSAFQASMFNAYLAERLERGWFERLLTGDVAKKTDTGGLFDVADAEVERPRFESGAITYTGPIYGAKMRRASGAPGELEQQVLSRFEVTVEALKRAGLDGSRRPARIILQCLTIKPHDQGLIFEFSLPKGAYATTLLREFMKNDQGLAAVGEED
ncbi:MAG: tRNA pseudouridine(13) synthase TruD [Thermodesulfobacteriota bacterium]